MSVDLSAMESFPETWKIDIDEKGRYHFTRWIDGEINESYRPASREEAAIWAVALVMGRVPPAGLRHSDKPKRQRIPTIYKQATWRNVTPVDMGEWIGVGLDCSGEVIRLKLPLKEAQQLVSALDLYLDTKRQSPISPGNEGAE